MVNTMVPEQADLRSLHDGRLRGSGQDLYIEIEPSAPSDMDLSLRSQLSSV